VEKRKGLTLEKKKGKKEKDRPERYLRDRGDPKKKKKRAIGKKKEEEERTVAWLANYRAPRQKKRKGKGRGSPAMGGASSKSSNRDDDASTGKEEKDPDARKGGKRRNPIRNPHLFPSADRIRAGKRKKLIGGKKGAVAGASL